MHQFSLWLCVPLCKPEVFVEPGILKYDSCKNFGNIRVHRKRQTQFPFGYSPHFVNPRFSWNQRKFQEEKERIGVQQLLALLQNITCSIYIYFFFLSFHFLSYILSFYFANFSLNIFFLSMSFFRLPKSSLALYVSLYK